MVIKINKQEMEEFMKQNYPNIDDFNSLPFVKSIRDEARKELIEELIHDDRFSIGAKMIFVQYRSQLEEAK